MLISNGYCKTKEKSTAGLVALGEQGKLAVEVGDIREEIRGVVCSVDGCVFVLGEERSERFLHAVRRRRREQGGGTSLDPDVGK